MAARVGSLRSRSGLLPAVVQECHRLQRSDAVTPVEPRRGHLDQRRDGGVQRMEFTRELLPAARQGSQGPAALGMRGNNEPGEATIVSTR